jgi:hypothetical protein
MLLWFNDDEAREIDNDPSEVMFGESSESNMSRDEVCLFIGQCSAIASTSSTLNARIMCPGLMVRVTIHEAPASGLASVACRAHAAHARDYCHLRRSRASELNLSLHYSISSLIMLALFLRLLSLAYGGSPIKREKESFEAKSHAVGDTIASAESRYDELSLNTLWIALPATANRTSSISLVQGNDLSSLALLNVMNGIKPSLTSLARDIALRILF